MRTQLTLLLLGAGLSLSACSKETNSTPGSAVTNPISELCRMPGFARLQTMRSLHRSN